MSLNLYFYHELITNNYTSSRQKKQRKKKSARNVKGIMQHLTNCLHQTVGGYRPNPSL